MNKNCHNCLVSRYNKYGDGRYLSIYVLAELVANK